MLRLFNKEWLARLDLEKVSHDIVLADSIDPRGIAFDDRLNNPDAHPAAPAAINIQFSLVITAEQMAAMTVGQVRAVTRAVADIFDRLEEIDGIEKDVANG
jgi:hypothetical protein